MTVVPASPAPRIVVTGVSGFVGRQLVPALQEQGAVLLLVGRDAERLKAAFPNVECCDYASWVERAKGFDSLVHLAVLNNDVAAPEEDFMHVNVDFLLRVLGEARRAGIRRFVNVSSIHALDEKNASAYAVSKREAAGRLATADGIETTTLYLATVYGGSWGGKLSVLNRLPGFVARPAFALLAALKPTLNVSTLAAVIVHPPAGETSLILSDTQRSQPVYRTVKRLADLAAALVILLLFWWLLALIWILIKRDSPGPGIFAQQRVGQDGHLFTCYKFRTMRLGTPQLGTHEVAPSAVTGIGGWLRRTKCDELPQVWNILRNEISLVGPRPSLPVQTALIEARRRRGVLALKPGITGLAQVNGIDMSEPARLALWDARYLALQSLVLDLKILLATLRGGGQGDRVRN